MAKVLVSGADPAGVGHTEASSMANILKGIGATWKLGNGGLRLRMKEDNGGLGLRT